MPIFNRISEQQAWTALVDLNRKFLSGSIAQELPALMQNCGVDPYGCVLVDLAPDGGGTWVGSLVTRDGLCYAFDLHAGSLATSNLSPLGAQNHSGAEYRRVAMAKENRAALVEEATSNTSLERTLGE